MELFVATKNLHKVDEIRSILAPGCSVRMADRHEEAPSVIEDAPTFEGNAIKKARALGRWLLEMGAGPEEALSSSPRYVLADDSGLVVDALNGAPGVHSARFAAMDSEAQDKSPLGNSSDGANIEKLIRLMRAVPEGKRTARFRCALALVRLDEAGLEDAPLIFRGSCEGRIGFEPSGEGGFGYDPLFFPEGYQESFAQLGEAVKNRLSHRARALEAMKRAMGEGNTQLTKEIRSPNAEIRFKKGVV